MTDSPIQDKPAPTISRAKRPRHGYSRTPEYNAWHHMLSRCCSPTDQGWRHYGARGIRVCDRWQYFANFIADMGLRPSPKHELDRIDNNGHYEPGNCRWATRKEQNANTRQNVRLTHNGRTLIVSEWVRLLGIPHNTIRDRMRRSLPINEVLRVGGRR